jgi:DNA-binding response OmpR family regulator
VARVVLIEDERELSELVSRTLEEGGHVVERFFDGENALRRLLNPNAPEPDILVLDLMLPRVDGLEICRQIRRTKIVPILMLTAKSTEIDRVLGLELGADDYLTKPVSLRELQARVAAILRRVDMMRNASRLSADTDGTIVHGDLRIDPASRDVIADEQVVGLTAKEFDLLYLLARIWGDDYTGFDRTVDTHILRIRRKLSGADSIADRIVTLWGVGYKYVFPGGVS